MRHWQSRSVFAGGYIYFNYIILYNSAKLFKYYFIVNRDVDNDFSLLLSYKEMETVSHSILCINVDQLFLLKY